MIPRRHVQIVRAVPRETSPPPQHFQVREASGAKETDSPDPLGDPYRTDEGISPHRIAPRTRDAT